MGIRALEPSVDGYATNAIDGVSVFYEVFGPQLAQRTIVFLPTWSLVHSRMWKAQVPYFARHGFRVVAFDGRGNGRSGRPTTGYRTDDFVQDTLSVLDAVGVTTAALVGISDGAKWGIQLAAEHPERVSELVLIGPTVRVSGSQRMDVQRFLSEPADEEGWNKYNAVYWRRDYRGFLDFFCSQVISQPHSTKQIEDQINWGLETTPDVLIATELEGPKPQLAEFVASVRCPVLIVHGTNDAIIPPAVGEALHAAIPQSVMRYIEGGSHGLPGREPVKLNLQIHEFLGSAPTASAIHPTFSRKAKRALFVSSPIGLGHAWRDIAVADALRELVPGLEIDWLAQDPVTRVLESRGERIHPMSLQLASEAHHIESECGEHDLHAFQTYRRMDEILIANFLVFHDTVRDARYDVWLADEGWDIDYFLHENPELKTAPYVWLTDFVGWLPMRPDEAWLTSDYNAQMLEHIERLPHIRDRSIFVGNPDDIVPDIFGEGLPSIRKWTEAHYTFPGYIQHFDPRRLTDSRALRSHLGLSQDECVVVASVGGTAVGRDLLQRIIDAYQEARQLISDLRLIVVAGPRIDPASLNHDGSVQVLGYVPNLYDYLAGCDLALVQGGLSTTMELVATGRPFLYFPLHNHFEQTFHVPRRLTNYGVRPDAQFDFADATPVRLADAIVHGLAQSCSYRPVETSGAAAAARCIAEVL
jgi:pimeloyl-ACP methyl ester carboxylesterase/predicted glycosyltransferase